MTVTTAIETVVVELVRPVVDGGAFPAKATVGELVTVEADVFAAGHGVVAAALSWRATGPFRTDAAWHEQPMTAAGNDRFSAQFTPDELGRWEFAVHGWLDPLETWRQATV